MHQLFMTSQSIGKKVEGLGFAFITVYINQTLTVHGEMQCIVRLQLFINDPHG